MMILYALVALLVAGLIVFFVLRTRSASAQQAGRSDEAGAAGHEGDRAALPKAASRRDEADADADATRVYKRTSHAAPAAPLKREGALPGTLAGAQLVCLSGHHRGHHFPVVAKGITIGRSRSCDIVLVDERVSSHHAWIGMVEGKVMLRDLNSTNGTYLNAHSDVPISEAELRPGDTIFFGGHQGDQFRFLAN